MRTAAGRPKGSRLREVLVSRPTENETRPEYAQGWQYYSRRRPRREDVRQSLARIKASHIPTKGARPRTGGVPPYCRAMRWAVAVVFCLLIAQAAGGAGPVRGAAAWTAYGHDAQLTNDVPSRVLTPKTAPRLRRVWSRGLDGAIVASPLVAPAGLAGAIVVVATEGGSVVALAASTGKELWRRSLGTVAAAKCGTYGISSTGVIDLARGRVYVMGRAASCTRCRSPAARRLRAGRCA